MPSKLIGQSMIEANLIDQHQLEELLIYQKQSEVRVPLGKLTVDLGLVEEKELASFLASYFNVPYIDLEKYPLVQKEAIKVVPEATARRFNILPLSKEDDTLTIAMSDPVDVVTIDNLETVTHCKIKQVVSSPTQIKDGIKIYYSYKNISSKGAVDEGISVSTLTKFILEMAIKNNINYIHIEEQSKRIRVFFRMGKRLKNVASYPKTVFPALKNFLKNAARLDVARDDTPQVGSFIFNRGELAIQVGISIIPILSGARIVLEVPYSVK